MMVFDDNEDDIFEDIITFTFIDDVTRRYHLLGAC